MEQSKSAVVHSLAPASSQESYGHAIDEFIGWYCSEPRLAFNRTVVLRYLFFLEQKNLAPSTINVRLAAVRRLAYEASDTGLVPAAGINGGAIFRRVSRLGTVWGDGITPKVIWHVVKAAAKRAGIQDLAPHDLRRYAV